jgi:hypothetical protein
VAAGAQSAVDKVPNAAWLRRSPDPSVNGLSTENGHVTEITSTHRARKSACKAVVGAQHPLERLSVSLHDVRHAEAN